MAKRLARILITTDFYEPHSGGVEHYVQTLASFFPDSAITVLTYRLPRTAASEKRANVTIKRIPGTSVLHNTHYLPGIKLPDIQPHDLVITNTRFFSTTVIGARLAAKWRVPRIHVEHGNQHVPHHNLLVRLAAWLYDQTAGRLLLAGADRVVCVSKKGLAFVRSLSAKNPLYIPNAIDPQLFRPSAALRAKTRAKYLIPKKARVVVFVGRLVQEKGVGDLIEALAGSGSVLLAVGGGPARGALEELCRALGVESRFIGEQNQGGVHAALCAADVFVNPSLAEGMPTSVLEALAARLQVIATAVGGTVDILPPENLVPPRNVARLRQALAAPQRAAFPAVCKAGHARNAWSRLVSSIRR